MFTIRVESERGHNVYSATTYRVDWRPDGVSLKLDPDRPDGSRDVPVPEGHRAFVMNAAGNTIDRIEWRARRAQLRTVASGGV